MVGCKLRRPEGDFAKFGFTVAAGGRGECSLLLRLDGSLWEIARGLVKGSGQLDWAEGGCRCSLQVGRFSGQWEVQVFVVEGSTCGGGEG